MEYVILFKKNWGPICYSNIHFVGDPETGNSINGYVFMNADTIIAWCSRKQKNTKAEYISISEIGTRGCLIQKFICRYD